MIRNLRNMKHIFHIIEGLDIIVLLNTPRSNKKKKKKRALNRHLFYEISFYCCCSFKRTKTYELRLNIKYIHFYRIEQLKFNIKYQLNLNRLRIKNRYKEN